MLCARALVRAQNDAKNYAQQGCAMQFDGITLRGFEFFWGVRSEVLRHPEFETTVHPSNEHTP